MEAFCPFERHSPLCNMSLRVQRNKGSTCNTHKEQTGTERTEMRQELWGQKKTRSDINKVKSIRIKDLNTTWGAGVLCQIRAVKGFLFFVLHVISFSFLHAFIKYEFSICHLSIRQTLNGDTCSIYMLTAITTRDMGQITCSVLYIQCTAHATPDLKIVSFLFDFLAYKMSMRLWATNVTQK